MIRAKLTTGPWRAHKTPMRGWRKLLAGMMVTVGTIPLAGCITLQAPQKPIVIQLDINITQQVVYRLAKDAGKTIQDNSSIF